MLNKIKDAIFFPLRVIFTPEQSRRLGLTPIFDERHNHVLRHVKGKLLDIGCGYNHLVKNYNDGIGIDVYPWKGIDVLVDTRHLPFQSKIFDTITFMANLNHIPVQIRKLVLDEAYRVLKDDGRIIITMIIPTIGYIGHKYLFSWRDHDQKERGIKEGESWGLSLSEIKNDLTKSNFILVKKEKFLYGFNNLYIASKN